MIPSGFTTSNARVYVGIIVGRSHDVPTQADLVKYSAVADASYGESIGVTNATPVGVRFAAPGVDFVNVIPCNIGDPCLIITGGGAPRLLVVSESPHWQLCEEETP